MAAVKNKKLVDEIETLDELIDAEYGEKGTPKRTLFDAETQEFCVAQTLRSMNKDTFFPNRILHFLLTILVAMVVDSPIIFLLKDIDAGIKEMLFFVVFCLSFLLIVALINYRKKNGILSFYTKRFDSLWLALLAVFIIQCLISQPFLMLLDGNPSKMEFDLSTILSSLVLAPIFEETIFRGVLLRGLLTRYSPLFSILVSSLLFALIHINISQILPALLLGLLFGLIFVKTHSLIFTGFLHFVANLTAWGCTFVGIKELLLDFSPLVLIIIATLALFLYGYCMMKLKKENAFCLK